MVELENDSRLNMLELPTVSVIIPCYNSARYISETINSIISKLSKTRNFSH